MPGEGLRLVFCEYLTFKTRQGNRTLRPINAGILAPLTRGSIGLLMRWLRKFGFATTPVAGQVGVPL